MEPDEDLPAPAISVVVPARDAAATLPAQLTALENQDFPGSWEVVVVENASTDETRDVIDTWASRRPEIRSISSEVAGASRARNLGVRASRGRLVLLCDADDVVAPGWVSAMVEALAEHDLVGGPLEFERLNHPRIPRPDVSVDSRLPTVFGMPYAVSANMGFRRAAFDLIGGFDESIGVGEDMDFGWRAHRMGLRLGTAPAAIVHYRLRSTLEGYLRQQYRYARGHAHAYAKHRAEGALAPRSHIRQLRAFTGDVVDIIRRVPSFTNPRQRWELFGRLAWVTGALAGAVRYGTYL
jgi:glycosyltransferase involved in cell wall biosynthesis